MEADASATREIVEIWFAAEGEKAGLIDADGVIAVLFFEQDLVGEIVVMVVGGKFGKVELHFSFEFQVSSFVASLESNDL